MSARHGSLPTLIELCERDRGKRYFVWSDNDLAPVVAKPLGSPRLLLNVSDSIGYRELLQRVSDAPDAYSPLGANAFVRSCYQIEDSRNQHILVQYLLVGPAAYRRGRAIQRRIWSYTDSRYPQGMIPKDPSATQLLPVGDIGPVRPSGS